MKVELSPSYILHSRPFRNTSVLIDCLNSQHGLVTLVGRGAKRRTARNNYLQPFILLQLSWMGHSELKTLTGVEAEVPTPKLLGNNIKIGLYLNELLVRLLQRLDPHPVVFYHYDVVLNALAKSESDLEQQFHLRDFELKLLAELGYGLDLTKDAKGFPIEPELLYCYDPAIGIVECSSQTQGTVVTVSGASIICLSNREMGTQAQMNEVKKLNRDILAHYLGNKPLESRKLFHQKY